MTEERRIKRVVMLGMFLTGFSLGMAVTLVSVAVDSPPCPMSKPIRVGETVAPTSDTDEPSPPPSAVEAKPEAPTPKPVKDQATDWKRAVMLPDLAGKWEDIDHKPTPRLELWVKRDNSKTDFNLRYEDRGNVSGGCGFNSDGEAWCKVFDDENRKVPKSVKTTVILEQRYPGALRAIIDGVGTFEVTRPIE